MALERGEAFARVGVDEARGRQQEDRAPLRGGAPDAPAQLIEVGEAERLRLVDEDRVGARDVDARFDDGGRQQQVVRAALEVAHLARERARVHLAVRDDDPEMRAERVQALFDLADGGDAVVEEEDLAAARELRFDGRAHDRVGVAHDRRLHRHALARRRAQERQVARARHRQVERARDGCRRQRQHVRRRAQALEEFLVAHAEALLLVDDDEPEVAEGDARREDGVRADHDVARARGEALEGPLVRAARLEARDGFDPHGCAVEARGERLEVLLGEDGRRREDGGLFAVERGDVGRAHRDFRLAVARVAADQPVHRLRRGEIRLDGGDGGELVGRLLEGERGLERIEPVAGRDVVGESGNGRAPCLRVEERGREVGDGALRVQLVPGPALAVEPVQAHLLALDPDVARQQVRVGGGNVELGAVGVFDGEDFAAPAVELDFGRADEAADAVIDMDDVFARLELVEIVDAHALDRAPDGRGAVAAGEDAVGLGDDDEAGNLEAAGEVVELQHRVAARGRRREVLVESPAGRVEKFGMVRLVRAELREAGQGGRLERVREDAARRGVARVDAAEAVRAGLERIGVVLEREDRGVGGQEREKGGFARGGRQVVVVRGDGQQFGMVDALDGKLRRGVEGAQGLEVVAEKFGADGELLAGAPRIDNAAAHAPVAFLLHGADAVIAYFRQFFNKFAKFYFRTRGDRPRARPCATRGDRPRRCGDRPREGERNRGDRPRGDGGGEGREGRDDDGGVGREVVGAQRGNRLEAQTERGLLAVQERREFEEADRVARGDEPQIVNETVGIGQARRDGEDDGAGAERERARDKCIGRAGQRRNGHRPVGRRTGGCKHGRKFLERVVHPADSISQNLRCAFARATGI